VRFLRFALASDDPKRPICDFLATGKPFVGPGKKNGPCEAAFYNTVDMPAEHFGLLILRMPNRVHAEFTKDERLLATKILQPQQIALEIRLIVEVHIKTAKVGVLRQ